MKTFFQKKPIDQELFLMQFIMNQMKDFVEEERGGRPANEFVIALVHKVIKRLNNPEPLDCPFKHIWAELKVEFAAGNIPTLKLKNAIKQAAEKLSKDNELQAKLS